MVAEAQRQGDALAGALSLGTQGLCALFRADWGEADRAISEARARLSALEVHDPEEVARVDHSYSPDALAAMGQDLEALALTRALKYQLEHRVLLNGHKTVIFK